MTELLASLSLINRLDSIATEFAKSRIEPDTYSGINCFKIRKTLDTSYLNSTKLRSRSWAASISNCFKISEKHSVAYTETAFKHSSQSASNAFSSERIWIRLHPEVSRSTPVANGSLLNTVVTLSEAYSRCLTNDKFISAERSLYWASIHWSQDVFTAGTDSAENFFST